MPLPSLKYADVLLAYRQAKKGATNERAFAGLSDYAQFEAQLHARIQELLTRYADSWFDQIQIGRLVVVPKSAQPVDVGRSEIVHVDRSRRNTVDLKIRIQLEASPDFSTAEVLYLHEFGPALESLLDESCVGYRLKRVLAEGRMDQFDRDIYEYWPKAFGKYRYPCDGPRP